MYFCVYLLIVSLSLSLGREKTDNRTLSLALYGGDIVDGSWTTAFSLDKTSENVSAPWKLYLNYSVDGQGKNRRMTVKGYFIDDGVDSADPISVRLFPVEAKFDQPSSKNCYDPEGGEGSTVKIVTRKELNLTEFNFKSRSKPADYVIVDASRYIKERTQSYASWLKNEYADEIKYYGGSLFNYLISDDGNVFEGAGRDIIASYDNGGLTGIALRISFVKENKYDPPSPAAIAKLKSLIRTALCLGMLSPNYKLIPFYHIYDIYELPADHFERETIKEWDGYVTDIDLGVNDVVQFPVAFREEWNWTRTLRPFANLSLPVELVIVKNSGVRCYTIEYCISRTKWYTKWSITTENFLIGDDGRAYEDRGWDYAPYEIVGGKSIIVVVFFGRYNTYLPSRKVFNAFNSLLRLGVLWGKLSPNYKVASYRSIKNDSWYIGDVLHEEVRKMERYTDEIY